MTRTLATLLALAVSATVFAQTEYPPREAPATLGPYAGVLLGRSEAKTGCIGVVSGGARDCDNTDFAYGAFGGYQFHRYFGAELGYTNLGQVTANANPGSFFASHSVDATAFDLAAVGVLPLGEVLPLERSLSFFVRLGAYYAMLTTDVAGVGDHSNAGAVYGGGLQFEATRSVGVRVLWQRYKNVGGEQYLKQNYDLLGVSAFYRF